MYRIDCTESTGLEKPRASEPISANLTSDSHHGRLKWNPLRAHPLTVQTTNPAKFNELAS
jgi:hypothetical protein